MKKVRTLLCAVIMIICLILLLGFTGTAELGGDLITYTIQGSATLIVMITAGIVGKIIS